MSVNAVFTEKDHAIWTSLFKAQNKLRSVQLDDIFISGLKALNITEERIPDLEIVNSNLKALTGWQGVYTKGFVDVGEFFEMLTQRQFPVGSFIRSLDDSSYTPEPDVFHDLYGHLPFFADQSYAQFCFELGQRAVKYKSHSQIMTEFQRLFWFTIEFGLVRTAKGLRVLGAGIASSFSECAYALSEKPRVHLFNVDDIRRNDFRIDIIQEDLYLLNSKEQLYTCLDDFERAYL